MHDPKLRARLIARAQHLSVIRQFFADRDVLELETLLLSPYTVSDPSIETIQTQCGQFLQSSPEYAMKRLLAAGAGDCFQLCKAFRLEEQGRWHRQEFLLLEWYRINFSASQLIDECHALLVQLGCPHLQIQQRSYHALLSEEAGLDDLADARRINSCLADHGLAVSQAINDDPAAGLDLLMSMVVAPRLKGLTAVYPFPIGQAALAKPSAEAGCAERFEIYWDDLELANGFDELNDRAEQARRFEADNQRRAQNRQQQRFADPLFLAALDDLPDCSGVAVGVERLLAKLDDQSGLTDLL